MSPSEKERAREDDDLEKLLAFLKDKRNFDFTGYKRSSLSRRISKRMATVKIDNYSDYQDYLEVHPDEFYELFNTILINVTRFFRDPPAWEFLAQEVIPQLLDQKGEELPIRAWSVGAASGQEAYTLAMLLAEALGKEQFIRRVKIYATDVDQQAINAARHAIYAKDDVEDVPEELRRKYFQKIDGAYQFLKEYRRCVVFGVHEMVQASPISRLDMLICRNTLMYFNAEIQAKILARFHFALNDNGILFLGMAETMLTRDRFFTPINQKLRIFRKLPLTVRNHGLLFAEHADEATVETGMRHQLSEASFRASPAAQFVVDASGILLMANSEAILAFGLDEKDIGRPFYELRVSYSPAELRPLIQEVLTTNQPINLTSMERTLADRSKRYMDIAIVPLIDKQRRTFAVSIYFADVTSYRELQKEAEKVRVDLEQAYEELQSTSEELETTNEELQSTVEELETANEELQSSNEEMETMNEELQATNEELQTINDELRDRTEELNQMNAFRDSILSSAPLSIIVLDSRMGILTWNKRSDEMWGLRSDEVTGQFFLNLDIGLPVEKLKNTIRAVIDEQSAQKVQLEARSRTGKQITVEVTATPLFGVDGKGAGVILLIEEEKENE